MSAIRQDNVSRDPDVRIQNILTATAGETGDLADLVRWLAHNLQHNRAALTTVATCLDVPVWVAQRAREALVLLEE